MSDKITLENGMTVESLIFAISSIISGTLDIIQMGFPDSVSSEDRKSHYPLHVDPAVDLSKMTDWERGAVDAALASVSILAAQTINDGIGNGDADMMLGDFSAICERYVASNWRNEGKDYMKRWGRLCQKGEWTHSELALDYPDADQIARRFVTELGLLP